MWTHREEPRPTVWARGALSAADRGGLEVEPRSIVEGLSALVLVVRVDLQLLLARVVVVRRFVPRRWSITRTPSSPEPPRRRRAERRAREVDRAHSFSTASPVCQPGPHPGLVVSLGVVPGGVEHPQRATRMSFTEVIGDIAVSSAAAGSVGVDVSMAGPLAVGRHPVAARRPPTWEPWPRRP